MAKESGRDKPTDELKTEIVRSRERVTRDLRGLRYELDFPRKIRRSFQQQTVAWITAAAIVGVLLVVLPMRKKKIYVNAKKSGKKAKLLEVGFALGALRIAATLLKPVIVSFVSKQIAGYGNRAGTPKKW